MEQQNNNGGTFPLVDIGANLCHTGFAKDVDQVVSFAKQEAGVYTR